MKVSILASLLCLFSATVLAAPPPPPPSDPSPPPPPGKRCKTIFREPGRAFLVESVNGQCKTLPIPAHPFQLEIVETSFGGITAFSAAQCQGPKLFDRQTPVQLEGPITMVSVIVTC